MKISIIGAGPVGCYTAYLLAQAGIYVDVYEEHPKIGEPLQCAGLFTSSIKKIIQIPDNIIINKIIKARIFSPNKKYIEFNFKKENIVVDRIKFDQWLAYKAKKAGAKIHLNHKFLDYKNKTIVVKYKKAIKKSKTDYLIGADGPISQVAKSAHLFGKRNFWTGIQVQAKLKNKNIIEFYPYIGTFAWIIPENSKIVRIGLLAKKNSYKIFKKFLNQRLGKNKNILDKQAGLVPIYNRNNKTQKKNIFLVGDAAGQVKATSAGGVIQGLTAAKCLVNSILKHKNYEKEWRRHLARDLWLHLQIRNVLDKFRNRDYNLLIYLMNKKKTKKILETFDRDYPTKFIFKLILSEPKLLLFIKKLF